MIRKRSSYSSSPSPKSKSSSSKLIKKQKLDEEECIMNDENFYDKFKKSINIIEIDINSFLESRNRLVELYETKPDVIDTNDCIVIKEDNKISINPNIFNSTIDGYITKGCFGYIFIGEGRGNKYIIKIIPSYKYNITEITTMKRIMEYNINNKTKIIPNYVYLLAYSLKCNTIKSGENELAQLIHKSIIINDNDSSSKSSSADSKGVSDGSYSMLIIEQFDNTVLNLISTLTEDKDNNFKFSIFNDLNEIIKLNSIFAQMALSIYILHNKFKYYHKDAHLANFLYKKITTSNNDYFHYKINNENYYIKNCGYLVVLSDFGLSKEITEDKTEGTSEGTPEEIKMYNLIKDYFKLLLYLKNIYIEKISLNDFKTKINKDFNIDFIKFFLMFINFPDKLDILKQHIKRLYGKENANVEVDFIDFMMSFLNIKRDLKSGEVKININPYDDRPYNE